MPRLLPLFKTPYCSSGGKVDSFVYCNYFPCVVLQLFSYFLYTLHILMKMLIPVNSFLYFLLFSFAFPSKIMNTIFSLVS
jgi:hypothetical protein